MKLIAYLRGRDLFILDEDGRTVFSDFLYYHDDTATATRTLSMYGYEPVNGWRDHPRIPGVLVCEVKGGKETVS